MSGGLRISCFDACALQEDDTRRFWTKSLGRYFNPRPPCGGRPCRRKCCRSPRRISIHVLRVEDDFDYLRDNMATSKFQSTSSMWRTTRNLSAGSCGYNISIHVLHVEDDACSQFFAEMSYDFNPRPPCGGRPFPIRARLAMRSFQSTSSMWRTT